MNPRISQAHAAPMMPFPANTRLSQTEALLLQARRARDAAFAAGLRRVVAAVRNWFADQRAISELRSLTDRELADIGLTRGTIAGAVRIAPAPAPAPRASAPQAANDSAPARAAA
jgi:uncharacterized protein YjiS (DUF1127 family)